jgi:hypothetical protein
MKLPFIRPRTASLEELRAQLDHAQNTHASAQAAVEAARQAFYETGTADSEQAVRVARESEQSAFEHVGRARYLLDKAEEARAAELRLTKTERRAELHQQLTDERRRKELRAKALNAWKAVATANVECVEHEHSLAELTDVASRLDTELGLEPVAYNVHSPAVLAYLTAEDLDAESRALPAGPQRDAIHRLARLLVPGGTR